MQSTTDFTRRRVLVTVAVWCALFLAGVLYFGVPDRQTLLTMFIGAGVSMALSWWFVPKKQDNGDVGRHV